MLAHLSRVVLGYLLTLSEPRFLLSENAANKGTCPLGGVGVDEMRGPV